jgi:hypothetical protein
MIRKMMEEDLDSVRFRRDRIWAVVAKSHR